MERARHKLLLEFIKMYCDEFSSSSSCSSPVKNIRREETELAESLESHDALWDCFKEITNVNNTS